MLMPQSATFSGWRLYLDAGGTFTDCLAISPDNTTLRVKILSHGALRGLAEATDDLCIWRLHLPDWALAAPLEGYRLSVLGETNEAVPLLEWDGDRKLARFGAPLGDKGEDFSVELKTGEPAPVMVARLLTQAPYPHSLPAVHMRLGTTRGTNALLERKGARVACILNHGLEDLPFIRDQRRPDLFALDVQKPAPLHHISLGVKARMGADGEVLEAITEEEIEELVQKIQASDVETVAVCLLHSYRNPNQEQQIRVALQEAGYKHISCSGELIPQIKLVPRMETTVVNAYLSPLFEAYLQEIAQVNPEGNIQIMTSAGGLQGIDNFAPKDSLLSGPAGGVVGALAEGKACGYDRLLTLDMGGTSTDVARVDGNVSYVQETQVGGAHLMSPAVAIETVAAGGGSICGFDGLKLFVGPESAGANPGPACYGQGGPLTLTDVNLLLGRLDPTVVSIPLNIAAAEQALGEILTQSRLEREACLAGFLQIANETMAAAIRKISQSQGYDPSDYALLAFGGAGGLHATAVAQELGINKIVIPSAGGILSAVGMRHAQLTRFASRQILAQWETAVATLPDLLEALATDARKALNSEGLSDQQIAEPERVLFLRVKGQEHSLEIPLQDLSLIPLAFSHAYQNLYGHPPPDLPLELVRVEVRLREKAEDAYVIELPEPVKPPIPLTQNNGISAYRWETLAPGTAMEGPCLLSSSLGTVFLETGWKLKVDASHNLRIEQLREGEEDRRHEQPEAVRLELFARRFQSVAEEMGALLQRTSFSVNVKERLDFSCALMDAEGYLIANAPHIPVHLGSMGVCTRAVVEALPLGPGDVAITNHPGFGGSHLPDITLVMAVFDDKGQRIGYLANRAHHAEVGGKRPGSMPPDAQNLAEEGVVIAPMKLVDQGIPQWQKIEDLFTQAVFPSRNLKENIADLQAALASLEAGRSALRTLARQVGTNVLKEEYTRLKQYSAQRLQQQIAPWKGKVWEAAERLDDGSLIQVKWKIGERIRLNFEGTSSVHPANLNANLGIVNSAVMYVLRLLIDAPLPLNEGLMQEVDLHVPLGSFLNPEFSPDPQKCPAVVGGNVETSQRLVDTLLKALALSACSTGSMNNLLFGDKTFGYYETLGGGTGAGQGFAGADGVHQHMTNTRMTDPELLEHRYPVQVETLGLRKGSGGNGKFPGGEGLVRRLRFLAPVELTVLTQHRKVAPYGMKGGEPGAVGAQRIISVNGKVKELAGMDQASLVPGDLVEMLTPGGGGWGREV